MDEDIDVYIMLLLFLNKKKKRTPGGFPYCIYEKVFPYLEVSDL